ncbi:MAG TPA: DUF2442 domain-containing protein [Longimicrobiaceae bacterium]|jgi:hypothetical protein|nr:DUF2442 domain-containing protein [Longimicrobiaceae bacterium]
MAPEWTPPTDEEILAQIPAAVEAGRIAALSEPRAASARYDVASGRIFLELTDGRHVDVPADRDPELRAFAPQDLAGVHVRPGGRALTWPDLDTDVSVRSLLSPEYRVQPGWGVSLVAEPRAQYGPDKGSDNG